jgi:c(7)-type cytochrome triheme protein
MKFTATIIAIVATMAFVATAIATMPGQNAEYEGGAMGKVVFDGQAHADAGLNCADCHTELFGMNREAKMTMADHNNGTFCFSCHRADGTAFASADNCARCHTK